MGSIPVALFILENQHTCWESPADLQTFGCWFHSNRDIDLSFAVSTPFLFQ